MNGKSITAMEDYLRTLQVSTIRRTVLQGLRKAKELLEQAPPGDARVVHVISDLRGGLEHRGAGHQRTLA